ncbi:sulfite exporter TauE/SafE family protein [Anaerobacillus sp. MEB173]|uniref:sulfite exporter TauE/SafE family protein n=1 Tax=Anaerobacillus sp. MEB173 TaxID=3383345 RepID=UPI003F9069E6
MLILVAFGVFCGLIASILGAGSSMMMAPLLLYVYPFFKGTYFSIHTITSATLALTFFSTTAASIRYHNANLIPYRYALLLAGSGAVGSFISGSYISTMIDHLFILILFGGIAILSFIFNFIPIKEGERRVPKKLFFSIGVGIIFFLGLITGIIGIGGMVLFMPYMVYVLGFSIRETIGTTTFVGAVIAFFGILGRTFINMMDWQVAIIIAIGGMVGGFIGPTLIKYFPDRVLRYGMNVILLTIIITVIMDIYKLL